MSVGNVTIDVLILFWFTFSLSWKNP